MKNKVLVLAAVLWCIWLVSLPARAEQEEERALNVRFLLQPQIQLTENGSPSGDNLGTEFFLHRARVVLTGKVSKLVHFFFETDSPNWGKNGNYDVLQEGKPANWFFVLDAFVDFQFSEQFNVAAGMLLVPFTHHSRQGAVTLHMLDYHNIFSKHYIAGKAWRDMGIEVRGFLAKMFEYRIGIFNGMRGKETGGVLLNPDDLPRLTGRVALNFADRETGFFYAGTYLGKKKIATVGFGFDYQQDTTLDGNGKLNPYLGISADLFIDWPISPTIGIVFQTAGVYYDRGRDPADLDRSHSGTGWGALLDTGIRYKIYELVVGGEWFQSDRDSGDVGTLRLGINYWLKGHNSNIKLEWALQDLRKETTTSIVTLQTQLLF